MSPALTWYLAQTKPNQYARAKINLERQGYGTFLPLTESTIRTKSIFRRKISPIFPGYIFVNVDTERKKISSISSTVGISKLVTFGSKPAIVPQQLISKMQDRCDSRDVLEKPEVLKVGQEILLKDGPFTNFLAKIESITPDQRVWLLLEVLNGAVSINMHAKDLTAS